MLKKSTLTLFGLVALSPLAAQSEDSEAIRIVGSSTVFPFVSAVAERFGHGHEYPTPIVESTGTGGGMKLFCEGVGSDYPDFTNASRQIKESEEDFCAEHGVTEIKEIPIGYDGIVLANAVEREPIPITRAQLFLALAKEVPVDGKLTPNPYATWAQIDASLPDRKIEVYGPPPTSGTRDAFVELVMEEACHDLPAFAAAYPDEKVRAGMCGQMREDGHYLEAGENDNLIIQKLSNNKDAFGLFGFGFLDQNASLVQANPIDGVAPDFDSISEGEYVVSRSLYVYGKPQHVGIVPGIAEFVREMTSEDAIGMDGYLVYKGLIPLKEEKRAAMHEDVTKAFTKKAKVTPAP